MTTDEVSTLIAVVIRNLDEDDARMLVRHCSVAAEDALGPRELLARRFAERLRQRDPRFDRTRFLAACGVVR